MKLGKWSTAVSYGAVVSSSTLVDTNTDSIDASRGLRTTWIQDMALLGTRVVHTLCATDCNVYQDIEFPEEWDREWKNISPFFIYLFSLVTLCVLLSPCTSQFSAVYNNFCKFISTIPSEEKISVFQFNQPSGSRQEVKHYCRSCCDLCVKLHFVIILNTSLPQFLKKIFVIKRLKTRRKDA